MRYIFSSSHTTAVVWVWETEYSVFVKGKLLGFVIVNGIKKSLRATMTMPNIKKIPEISPMNMPQMALSNGNSAGLQPFQ